MATRALFAFSSSHIAQRTGEGDRAAGVVEGARLGAELEAAPSTAYRRSPSPANGGGKESSELKLLN